MKRQEEEYRLRAVHSAWWRRFVLEQFEGVRIHVRVLLLMQFLMNLATFTAMPLMAVHMVDHLGLAAAAIGTVFTIHLALGRALPIITGPLVDRFGFRNLMVLGLLARSAGFLLFSLAFNPAGVVGATLLIGLGTASYESALYGIFGRQSDDTITRVFVLNNFALNMGVVVGPTLGTVFILYGTIMPFRVAALLFLLLGLWSMRFGYLDHLYESRSTVTSSWAAVSTDRRFLWFLATTLPWWFLFSQLFVAFPLHATRVAGNESAANAVFVTNGVSGLIFVVVSLFAFKWIKPREMNVYCYAILLLAYLIAPAWHLLSWVLLVVFIYTVAESLILPAIETVTAELAPDGKQATYFGALGLAWGMGSALGSYVGSWAVLEAEAPWMLWGVNAAVAIIGLGLAIAFRYTERSFNLRTGSAMGEA
ncbi:hypothetical protein C6558_32420 [Ensifer sp. NM-2]|uniref:MFS transporter n=1 Tax=Ensifer sp. NM-2 TaxID=2109730 RepID=UPI000D12024D|nr:MFS transporter [Ensifer sp. NM-2]PSS60517.1 hypothetical protein C6558_32420 [Ensifer sp. NM-2]